MAKHSESNPLASGFYEVWGHSNQIAYRESVLVQARPILKFQALNPKTRAVTPPLAVSEQFGGAKARKVLNSRPDMPSPQLEALMKLEPYTLVTLTL